MFYDIKINIKMKKTIKYIFALAVGCMIFTSCEDPYAGQYVAKPGSYDQATLQDPTFTVALKSGVSPLVIQAGQLSSQLSLLTCTAVPVPLDTLATVSYKLQLSNLTTFAAFKNVNSTYSGKVNEDVKVNYKEFNDSIKTYNKNAVQRPVYLRLVAYISRAGLKTAVNSAISTLTVTPYNYPPIAINDVATLPMNSSITIDVLSNDTDPEGDVLTLSSVGTPGHGTATISSGKILYTPTNGYFGADNFGYTISDGNGNTASANVDVTILAVNPYNAVTLRPWYLVGEAIGNGSWNNSTSGLGAALYPLSVVPGNKYNSAGDGEYSYTGYLVAGKGFKLLRNVGDWNNDLWGMDGSTYVHNGGGNISVPTSGYYTITLNSIANTLTIVAATAPTASYTSMGLIGEFNGWGSDVLMTPGQTSNNHIWYTTYTFTTDFTPPVGNGGLKFRGNSDWSFNWGAGFFPVGLGTNSGTNIPFKAGTYIVIFNDIDGCYYFIKQ